MQFAGKKVPRAVYLRYMQFSCKAGKFTCVEAASTSRRIHANCLQAHVNLPEYHRHFTGNFTCGTHAYLPRLACKIACFCRQKYMQFTGKNTRIAGKNTRQTQAKITETQEKIPAQSQAKKPAIPRKITCNCRLAIAPRVNSPANCR